MRHRLLPAVLVLAVLAAAAVALVAPQPQDLGSRAAATEASPRSGDPSDAGGGTAEPSADDGKTFTQAPSRTAPASARPAPAAGVAGAQPGTAGAPERRSAGADAEAPVVHDPIIVHSFDQTPIVATLMLPAGASAERPVPAVLETHGWGGTRRVRPGGLVAHLLGRGYAVLTWDSRGFGQSGGEVNIGAPEFEGRDAQALLDYLADRPEIAKDGPGDPRVGWIGVSNAGGVQLNTAAFDSRIDAIVPIIAWGNLLADLLPNGVVKQTWAELLYWRGVATAPEGLVSPAGTQAGVYAREIHLGHGQIVATGELSSDVQAWFAHRSTVVRSQRITAPTLLVQGAIDTLFPLQGAFANYRNLRSAGTEVKLVAYCGGHSLVGCRYPGGSSGYPGGAPTGTLEVWEQRAIDWIERHVGGKRHVDTGPPVEWQAQDGRYYGASSFPLPDTRTVTSAPLTIGPLVGPGGTGGDGPTDGAPAGAGELGRTAVRVTILDADATARRALLGRPSVELRGVVEGLTAFAFLEVVDVAPDGTRRTINDQTMPVRLGNGRSLHSVDLHGLAWVVEPGHALELEVTTGSAQYSPARTGPYRLSAEARVSLPLAPLPPAGG